MRINCRRKLAVQYPSFSTLQVWWRYFHPQPGGQRWAQYAWRERASKKSIYRLLYLGLCAMRLCGFGKSFSPSLIGNFLLLFHRTSFFLSFQPRALFFLIFRHTFWYFAIHDRQNEHKRKLGVNKSQVANVNKRKRGDMKWTTPKVLPRKTLREALTLTNFNWPIALWRVIEFHLKKLSCW